MAVEDDLRDERLWLSRLRWRLRGAAQWPAFAVLTLADALILHWLPFSGSDGSPFVAAFLICGFLNLGLIAAGGPLVGRLVRRSRPALPVTVAADRAATGLMVALTAVFLFFGLLNRDDANAIDAHRSDALGAARAFDRAHAPARFQPGVGRENVADEGDDLFRICVPGPDRRRNFCVYVDTKRSPPRVREDPEQNPNSVIAGPDNPGRQVGG